MIQESQLERAYECNCHDVKIGMTADQATTILQKGLDINFQGYDYEITMSDNKLSDLYLAYSTNGGCYIAAIYIDKETGLVLKTDCPPNTCKD
ncbi:hypothetical protein [Pontibacter chitinilyticus]|uniref:hypothetical protein n=1 Tax=Pontibacter chitinilyticus TaxID=2674989 RepID=UPI003219F123